MKQENASPRSIFHVDMDAFYASIEVLNNPSLKGKPVIVGAKPGNRGVVSAASYEARKYGVHSAMPVNRAYEKCPMGVFITPHMDQYIHYSKRLMAILESYSPLVEQISVDEAFLDMGGTEKLFGPPMQAAHKLQQEVFNKLKLTCSVGIAPNKFLAKIASDIKKPFGITQVPNETESIIKWLAPLPINKIWGVGKQTSMELEKMGIEYVSDLQRKTEKNLQSRFGKWGQNLYRLSRGIDFRLVEHGEKAKSISREHTFPKDNQNVEDWKKILLSLSRDVAERARHSNQRGKTVVLTYRNTDFSRHSKRKSLDIPGNSVKEIYNNVLTLLERAKISGKKIRLIGVGLTNFDSNSQIDLFQNKDSLISWEKTENAMDNVKQKFGKQSIYFGGEI